ncbi:MAG: DUF2752 domain-containing protein, partial [Clostridia bacterium]|nr:DUF2752 domain-containing protein [Clostridia bacterium]
MKVIFNQRILKLIFLTTISLFLGLCVYIIYDRTGFGFKCLFYELTSLKCPGCGNTHFIKNLID